MTANARNTKPAVSKLPTLDDVAKGIVTLDEYEVAHGEDIRAWTEEDFARARPISDFPELKTALEKARQRQSAAPKPDRPVDVSPPTAVRFEAGHLHIELADGRELAVPLTWYPALVEATAARRAAFALTPTSVRWPELGEEAPIAEILRTQQKIAALQQELAKKQ